MSSANLKTTIISAARRSLALSAIIILVIPLISSFQVSFSSELADNKDFVRENNLMEKRINSVRRSLDLIKPKSMPFFKRLSKDYYPCAIFAYTDLYARFSYLIDSIDTEPFEYPGDYRQDRYDARILTDPRMIAVEIKSMVGLLRDKKDFVPPLPTYAALTARDPIKRLSCRSFLPSP